MEKINVAELLKDCPSGMELDCTMYDDVEFMEIDTESDTIILRVGNKFIRRLNKHGQDDDIDCAKCVIFPKGKTTWEGFHRPNVNYINGDVIVDKYGAIALYKGVHSSQEEPYVDFHCGITSEYRRFLIKDGNSLQHCGKIGSIRLATEEEKAELFQAIKDNGYKWNAETKTLEKLIESRFKVGDRIKHKTHTEQENVVTEIENTHYILDDGLALPFVFQDEYELVPDKFDINALIPFESKVLIRNDEHQYWIPAFWGFKGKSGYTTTFGWCKYCIPYEGNEHLFKTKNDCDEFFKTWK